MSRFRKGLVGVVVAGIVAGGGFAASVALAAHTSAGWTPGNCAAAAENAGARSASITAILKGANKAGTGCSITISGKFTTLPRKNVPVGGFVRMAPVGGAKGVYTGTIKTNTFHALVTLTTDGTLTLPNTGGCGWSYQWIGGHWVAMYTTC